MSTYTPYTSNDLLLVCELVLAIFELLLSDVDFMLEL